MQTFLPYESFEDVDQYMFPQAEIIKLAWTTTE